MLRWCREVDASSTSLEEIYRIGGRVRHNQRHPVEHSSAKLLSVSSGPIGYRDALPVAMAIEMKHGALDDAMGFVIDAPLVHSGHKLRRAYEPCGFLNKFPQ